MWPRRFQVARQTVHVYQMRPEVEARIVAMRREHPGWGPDTVLYWLELEGRRQLPGRTTVERCSARHETGA